MIRLEIGLAAALVAASLPAFAASGEPRVSGDVSLLAGANSNIENAASPPNGQPVSSAEILPSAAARLEWGERGARTWAISGDLDYEKYLVSRGTGVFRASVAPELRLWSDDRRLSTRYSYRLSRTVDSADPGRLGQRGSSWSHALRARPAWKVGADTTVGGSALVRIVDYTDSNREDRSVQLAGNVRHGFSPGFSLGGELGVELARTTGIDYSHQGPFLSVDAIWLPTDELTLSALVSTYFRHYPNSESSDANTLVLLEGDYQFSPGWSWVGELTVAGNTSTLPREDYSAVIVLAGVRYLF